MRVLTHLILGKISSSSQTTDTKMDKIAASPSNGFLKQLFELVHHIKCLINLRVLNFSLLLPRNNTSCATCSIKFDFKRESERRINPIRHKGGMMAPKNVFDHCAQTCRRRKLKLGDF